MKSIALLKRFVGLLRPYQKVILLTVSLVVVWTVINFIPPWLVKVLIDDALPRQDRQLLMIIVALQVFVALNHQFMSAIKGYCFTFIEQRFSLDLNVRLFDHMNALPLKFFNANDTGTLVHRFTQDVTQIQELVRKVAIEAVVQLVILVLLVGVLFLINTTLAIVGLSIIAIYAFNANVFKNRIYGAARDIGERTGGIYSALYQLIPGIREIKSLNIQKYARLFYARSLIRLFKAQITNYRLSVYVGLIADMLPYLGWAVLVAFGGRQVINGALTIGGLLAFMNYLDRLYAPVNVLSGLYSEVQRCVPAMERVAAILDTAPEFNTYRGQRLSLSSVKGHVTLNTVGFSYTPERPVHRGISLDIPAGGKVAIVGPSGCGKSTLAHLLLRYHDVGSGSIYLDGINIKQINIRDYRRHVGIVPQGIKLFNATIRDNIRMGRRNASDEDIIAAAKAANAHDFIANLPNGFDTLYGEGGILLSGGESQRVVIARALLQNPRVLILDEATSAVDANSEALIQDALNRASEGRTVIAIAHRFSTIIDSDVIYVMDGGRIIEQGDHRSLLERDGLYASLYRRQVTEEAVSEYA